MKTSAALLRTLSVEITNLSAAGCQFRSHGRLAIGTIGQLEVNLGEETRTEWFRVTRVHASTAAAGGYLCGAEFLRLSLAGEHSVRGAVHRIVAVPAGHLSGGNGRSAGRLRAVKKTVRLKPRVFGRKNESGGDSTKVPGDGSAVARSRVRSECGREPSTTTGEEDMRNIIARFVRDDQGQDLIEYVLIATFVSVGALTGATALGTQLDAWYQGAADWVSTSMGPFAGGGN